MQLLYCWRCGQEMPMLDEEEFAIISTLHRDVLRIYKQVEEKHDHPRRGSSLEQITRRASMLTRK